MAVSKTQYTRGIILRADDVAAEGVTGELKVGLTSKTFQVYLDSAIREIITADQVQTLENKTINAPDNTITNIANVNIASSAAISATKIANGTISNTEFQYLNGVTSNIQDQLDAITDDGVSSSSVGTSVDNHLARFDGTTGKIIQDGSTVVLSDAGAMSGVTLLDVDNIRLNGNTISTTNTDGDLMISPNGTGNIGLGTTSPAYNVVVNEQLSIKGNTAGLISNNTGAGIEELGIRANSDALTSGSNGAGIFLYGNGDANHPGNFVVATGANDAGEAKQIITQDKIYFGAVDSGLQAYADAGSGVGTVNIKDDFTGTTGTPPSLYITKDATSTGGSTVAASTAVEMNWTEESAQDIGPGEGVSIDWSVKLVADVSNTVVAQIAGYKENGTDTNRQTALIFTTSTDGIATPTEKMRVSSDGVVSTLQPSVTSKSGSATLTAAELRTRIIQFTGASAANLTLPTGTNLEAATGAITDTSFDFTVINTGTATATIVVNTGVTSVGVLTVTADASAQFRLRRTGTNTFIVYRLGYGATSLTADVSGILPLANGGTNKNMTAVNGGVVYTDSNSMEVTAAGTSGQFLRSNGAAAPTWVTVSPGALQIATISDVKASGASSGTFTSGALRTRTLNTLVDTAGIVTSLAANQFTLAAGTYYIEAEAPAYAVNGHQTFLVNITDSVNSLIGTVAYSSSGVGGATPSIVKGEVTIAGSKTFELQHGCETTKATDGFGYGVTFGANQVFSIVKITKIS